MGVNLAKHFYQQAQEFFPGSIERAENRKEAKNAIDSIQFFGDDYLVTREMFLISTGVGLVAVIHEFAVALFQTGAFVYMMIKTDDKIEGSKVIDMLKDIYKKTGTCLKVTGLSFVGFIAPSANVEIEKWLNKKEVKSREENEDNFVHDEFVHEVLGRRAVPQAGAPYNPGNW